MYKKLLVSAGGGITSARQQVDQAHAATIAIGLGGTGISCLHALKKEVYDRVKPDSYIDPKPIYNHIKFLAVDSDRYSVSQCDDSIKIDEESEYVDISCNDIKAMLAKGKALTEREDLKWLKVEAMEEVKTAYDAVGVRQVGRLLLMLHCRAFVDKLTATITNAIAGMADSPDINIHIFTGMCGGTGAGTFLDVCYILKKVLENMVLKGRARVFGYFFMPDVNIISHNADCLKPTGFASMKELDYCMNYANNGGMWSQQYDGFKVETTEPPVDLAHLISAVDFDGSVKENPYDYAMSVVVDYVMEFIVKPYSPAFIVKPHIPAGANNYCVLGAAKAYLPYKDITTYLTSKIFEKFGSINNSLPTDADIDSFLQINNLTYESIVRELNRDAPAIPLVDVNGKQLQAAVMGMGTDVIPGFLTPMQDATRRIAAVREINKSALIGEKTTKLKQALCELAADKGPYYAAAMLNSITGRSIMDYINGYIKQNEANLQYAQANLELREHAWANTLNKLQNAKVGKDRKAKDYIAAVRSWLVEDDKIRMYSTMKELLVAFKSQIEELRTSFFSVFTDVFAELQDTFRENLAYFAEPQLQNVDNSKKIITIDELRDTLDESVSEFNIDSLLRDFVGMMMSDPNVWITRDANKISAAVNGYFACMFDVYTRKSIIDYLQIKYDTTTPQILREHIYNDLVLRLHNESKPLLWLDQSYYHTQSIASMGYVVAPENAPEVIDAVDQYVANIGVTERIDRRLASYNDSISFVRIAYGIPMFAYQGVTLYLESYKNNSRAGIHIYEGAKGDARDSRELVDIMPI